MPNKHPHVNWKKLIKQFKKEHAGHNVTSVIHISQTYIHCHTCQVSVSVPTETK